MKKLFLPLLLISLIFSCSNDNDLNDNIEKSELKKEDLLLNKSTTNSIILGKKKKWMSANKDRSYVLVCDSLENVISYRYIDGIVLNSFNNTLENEATCDPYTTGGDYLFKIVPWQSYNDNSYFLIDNSPVYSLGGRLSNYFSKVTDIGIYPQPPGSYFEELGYFEIIYHEAPTFDVDPDYGDYYNFENLGASINQLDYITPQQLEYLRDEVTCEIINARVDFPGYIQLSQPVQVDHLLCSVDPFPSCDSRYFSVRISHFQFHLE